MTKLEYYSRALEDSAYRREQLADARCSKDICIRYLWFLALAGATSALLAGLGRLQWDTAAGWTLPATIAGFYYERLCTQIAVLESMERSPGESERASKAEAHPSRQAAHQS
jgi:hypothetical protein